jgi:Putative zinc-finger/FecR protein
MFGKHATKKLSAYCHGELSTEDARSVAEHVLACPRCHRELEEIKLGIKLAEQLPQASAPKNLWSEIETKLDQQALHQPLRRPQPVAFKMKRSLHIFPHTWYARTALAAVVLLFVAISGWFYFVRASGGPWEVARLDGAPMIGADRIGATGKLAVGEWLETDNNSRARISVGKIGNVWIDPNTRVRLMETGSTEHRLALARGRMHATIWAPPRLFFVDTPSAQAVDLGCAYTLEVDDAGDGLLRVTSGWVALDLGGHESVVPAGAVCATRPGTGPGTPYYADATAAFRGALTKLDFEKGDDAARSVALDAVLQESRPRDAFTLWHLLSRVGEAERGRVYERLAALAPMPEGVTRDGVLKLNQEQLNLWRESMGVGGFEDESVWRKAWRAIWSRTWFRVRRRL